MRNILFSNDKSILREKTVSFKVRPLREELDSIYYHSQTGYYFKSFHRLPPPGNDCFYIDDNAIIEAGYLLCRFSPQKFYNLYRLVLDDKDRELLLIALTRIVDEYEKFTTEGQEGKIEIQNFNFWSGNYYITTVDNALNSYSINIELDSNYNLEACYSQYRNLAKRDFGNIFRYGKELKFDRVRDSAIFEYSLSEKIAQNFAHQLCQSDVEEYQKLLQTINPNDQYYQAIVNGGSSFAADVKTLSRKLL